MASMQEEIEKYKGQVKQYDSGRPTTMSADKLGNRVMPTSGPQFDASYDAKTASLAQVRGQMPVKGFDASQDAKVNSIARMPLGDNRSPLMGGADLDNMQKNFTRLYTQNKAGEAVANRAEGIAAQVEGESLAANPARQMGLSDDKAMLVAAADTINRGNKRGPLPVAGETKDLAPDPLATPVQDAPKAGDTPDNKGNSFQGNFVADNAQGQGIFKDPATGRTSLRLVGDEGRKFMNERIPTARPGMTLSATEVKSATPRRPVGEYGGMYANGGAPGQSTAEAALQRKQMEVMNAERADKSLLSAPGSRGYTSPTLSEADQRVRQDDVFAQQRQDMRDARDNTIAQMEVRDAALAARGIPSDATRNQSMAPYEARRTDINTRDAMLSRAQEQEKTGATVADNAATRAADMAKTKITDATTRRGQDVDKETNRINAEIASQSKALDRKNALDAARLKIDNTADPIMLKKVDGYNSWLESVMSMGQAPTPEQMLDAQQKFGVSELFAAADPYAKVTIPAPK
jgi:hypothetical protein